MIVATTAAPVFAASSPPCACDVTTKDGYSTTTVTVKAGCKVWYSIAGGSGGRNGTETAYERGALFQGWITMPAGGGTLTLIAGAGGTTADGYGVVGQGGDGYGRGGNGTITAPSGASPHSSGGGGGSAILVGTTPLVVAGGGGGSGVAYTQVNTTEASNFHDPTALTLPDGTSATFQFGMANANGEVVDPFDQNGYAADVHVYGGSGPGLLVNPAWGASGATGGRRGGVLAYYPTNGNWTSPTLHAGTDGTDWGTGLNGGGNGGNGAARVANTIGSTAGGGGGGYAGGGGGGLLSAYFQNAAVLSTSAGSGGAGSSYLLSGTSGGYSITATKSSTSGAQDGFVKLVIGDCPAGDYV
jgi:hypothetical protein